MDEREFVALPKTVISLKAYIWEWGYVWDDEDTYTTKCIVLARSAGEAQRLVQREFSNEKWTTYPPDYEIVYSSILYYGEE